MAGDLEVPLGRQVAVQGEGLYFITFVIDEGLARFLLNPCEFFLFFFSIKNQNFSLHWTELQSENNNLYFVVKTFVLII